MLGEAPLTVARDEPQDRLPTPSEQFSGAYLAEVRAIAPQQIHGREEELRTLADFCVGENAYQWWQGSPWAGKTALAAWFVLHPPPGIRVAWFFITGRVDGRADSNAFTSEMIEQLALLAQLPIPRGVLKAARSDLFDYLLDAAARRLRERHERLVLVVDGLDEDAAGRPGSGLQSIASLLPYSPPDGVHVLVTSREHPPLPDDVPSRHPLLTSPRLKLNERAETQTIAAEARKEILAVLQDVGLDRDILTLIIAAGGGLTAAELAELTERTTLEVENRLRTALGRSLSMRPALGTTEAIYIFAHETLRETANQILNADLDLHRARIHNWAEKYRSMRWPERTPRYLFEPYARMLTTAKNRTNLAALATDRLRHDRMLTHAGADTAGIIEVTGAQDLLEEPAPDLSALALLAAERDRLASRNENIPVELPMAWLRLGHPIRAVDLARNIPEAETRARAIAALAADIGRLDPTEATILAAEAERSAFDPTRVSTEDWALTYVVRAFAIAGEREHAEEIAAEIGDLRYRAQALAEVAVSWAAEHPQRAARLASEADRLAHALLSPDVFSVQALAGVGARLAECYPSRALRLIRDAERVARDVSKHQQRGELLAEIAAIIAVSHRSRAVRLAREAGRDARSLNDWWHRRETFRRSTIAFAAVGMLDQAEETAREITDIDDEGYVLAEIAAALARAGLKARAERAARSIMSSTWQKATALARVSAELAKSDPGYAARTADEAARVARLDANYLEEQLLLRDIATALAVAGFVNQARAAASNIASSSVRATSLSAIAATLAVTEPEQANDLARQAIAAARDITNQSSYQMTLCDISEMLSEAGLYECAKGAIIDIEEPHRRVIALAGLAVALAGNDRQAAAKVAQEAANIALSIDRHLSQDYAILRAVRALSTAGLLDHARRVTLNMADPQLQAQAFAAIAAAMVADHLYDEAEILAADITDPGSAHTMAIVAAATSADDPDRASRIARTAWITAADLTNSHSHQESLIGTIKALSAAGQWNLAEDLAESPVCSETSRQQAFAAIAVCYARTRRWKRAEETLQKVTSPAYSAEALTEFISFLAEIKNSDAGTGSVNLLRMEAFIGRLLVTSYWKKALVHLGPLAPGSVTGLYEWVTSP